MKEYEDRTFPDVSGRVKVSGASPSGFGTVVRQDAWTVVLRMEDDGKLYVFGKNVIELCY